MQLRRLSRYPCAFLLVLLPTVAFGQSTYHLHKETSTTGGGVLQLKTSGPDAASTSLTVDLKGRPAGDYPIKSFDTVAGSPNASGVIATGSSVSAVLWMRKTANVGAMYPRAKLTLNSASGPTVCEASGATPLTTTMTVVVLNCATPATITMTVSDRFHLAVGVNVAAAPGNKQVKVELRIEGTLNGNHDSRVTVPMPTVVPSASIVGVVSDADGGAPVAGATIEAYAESVRAGFATANGQGAFTIGALEPRAYSVQAAGAGYQTGEQSVVAASGATTVNFSLAREPAGPASYAYDALGRLIQATSASGQSAIYRYDAVGNILAIERPGGAGTSPVAISGFAPSQGPTGTAVTIAGSGFSTTGSENIVTFNGVAGSVAAATAAQLVAAVPAGATTGPIAIVSPAGSATSASAFTVLSNGGGIPTITGLTPAIGVIGTPFTISGANFETTAANDRVTLNIRPADVTTATSTSLATSVPLASMGGRITLATPMGTVVSDADFVVVPSPYTAADVESSQRIAPGETRTMSISAPGRIAVLLFDGVAGEFVSATSTSSTWTSCQFGGQYSLTLYRPDASIHALVSNACGASTLMDHQMLPLTGTYTLMLDPIGSNVGSTTVSLFAGADVIGTITADGTPVPVTISTPTQNARLTFAGNAGQVVSATVSDATFPGNCLSYAFSLTILKPDGSGLPWAPSCGGSVFMDQRTLPVSGTYTLFLDPGWTGTGTATVRLYTVSDLAGSITADGTNVPVSITAPGQNARFAFAGMAGQVVSGLVSNATIPGFCGGAYAFALTLLRPDGSTQASIPSCGGGVFLDRQTLSTTGTYTLVLDPVGTSTGTANVALYNVVDVTGPIEPNGVGVPVSITAPGQNARLTFTGTAGQVVTASTANNTIPGFCGGPYAYSFSILKPDGSTLVGSPSCGGSISFGQRTLPVSGTYTLLLDPVEWHTGSITLLLTSP